MKNSREVLQEIDFYLENKESYSKEERKLIKTSLRKSLKSLGESIVNFIDHENHR